MSLLSRNTSGSSQPVQNIENTPRVVIGTIQIPVEVVSKKEDIDNGLSKRTYLEASAGMLFLFDHTAQFKFWMRGMRFPLDIIWIDEHYRIRHISENVPVVPLFKRPIFYSPPTPVQYVLEVHAHFCEMHGIQVGAIVEFMSLPV